MRISTRAHGPGPRRHPARHVRRSLRPLALAAVGLAVAGVCARATAAPAAGSASPQIRIGIPVTTLINGQIGLVLERTNILKLNGLDGKVLEFTSGPPQNEALAAGQIDVALTSEGPATLGISQGIDTLVIASFGRTRDALLVGGSSGIRTPRDLKGKTIGVPFGTTPFLHLIRFLDRNNLRSSVKLVNIGAAELAAAFASGSVDGVEYNEPLPTQLSRVSKARVVASDHLAYATVMRRDYLTKNRPAAVRFMAALADASLYMATHRKLVDRWFADVSRADVSVVRLASQHSPIYQHTRSLRDVKIGLSRAFVARLQADADAFVANGFAKSAAKMNKAVDMRLWLQAKRLLKRQHNIIKRVRVVSSG
jgi:ABC-type nitrate/sulfonate/bicarbonate transport system substrate-binding protein